jgi:hypothetical protein
VDLAKKRRGGCSWKRPSYYLVERTVVFSECTLPVLLPEGSDGHNNEAATISFNSWELPVLSFGGLLVEDK